MSDPILRVVAPEELLPTCRALAADMLSCDPGVLRQYKRVIDDGYAVAFGDGLRVEADAAEAHARTLTPETLAARRASVRDRGRAQTKGKPPVEKAD